MRCTLNAQNGLGLHRFTLRAAVSTKLFHQEIDFLGKADPHSTPTGRRTPKNIRVAEPSRL
jgi:hypothetical protein